MCDELSIESTFIQTNGDVVNDEELKDKKMTMTFTSSSLDHIVDLKGSKMDGSDSKRDHSFRSSIANLTQTIHERARGMNTTENVTKLIKFYTVVKLVVIICVMVVLFSVPVILYLTKPPAVDSYVINGSNFESCTVS